MTVRRILAAKGRDVATIAIESTVSDAVRLLSAHRVGALIVEDSGGALAGISQPTAPQRSICRFRG